MFAMRSAGGEPVDQFIWIYEHPIDFDRLTRFHRNLGQGLLARRIERSPLPFARHRWVSDPGLELDIAECAPRRRAELSEWADVRAQLPIDAESGPGWRLGVVRLTDGSTAISLEASHFLIDGIGLTLAVSDAVLGNPHELGYPPPGSRTLLSALAEDAWQTAADAPEIVRALAGAATLARRRRDEIARKPAARPVASREDDEIVSIPGLTIFVALDEWDRRAKALGGTSNTLLAGLGAKLAQHLGRQRARDGAITVQLPVNERTQDDHRANALSFVRIIVDPTHVTTDLRDVRAALKEALRTARQTPDLSSQTLPLVLLMPQRTLKRIAAAADPDLPVACSNLGDIDPVVCRIDGTEAEYFIARGISQRPTKQRLTQLDGEMAVVSWRFGDKIGFSVQAYRPNAQNTKRALRELAARTLAEFDLTGAIE